MNKLSLKTYFYVSLETRDFAMQKSDFLYSRSTYRGQPHNLAFNTQLQEFSQRLSYLCALESSGKLSQEESYQKIETLWKQLESLHP